MSHDTLRPALPAPFDDGPNPSGIRPARSTERFVRGQVKAMLASAPSFHDLDHLDQSALEHHMVKIAAYAAECVRDDWAQSEKLGQRPVEVSRGLAASDEFAPAAADQIGRVTEATLRAISFPEFVADLIHGSFDAIVTSSIQQMEAYGKLLEDVSKTVDQFMADNITDNQARDWLVQRYPSQIALGDGTPPQLVARDGAEEAPPPGWREALGLPTDVDPGDEDGYEEVLVPAARRKLAQNRLQTLSTLVLMGINRVIVTGGKIRATMAYHIDTSDRAAQQHASDFDFRQNVAGSFGWGPWSASASTSIGYVTSTRTQTSDELNVAADLTGEVEIHFRSDVMPLERFADAGRTDTIRANTAVPAANPPPWGDSPAARAEVRTRENTPATEPMRELPPMLEPPPVPERGASEAQQPTADQGAATEGGGDST